MLAASVGSCGLSFRPKGAQCNQCMPCTVHGMLQHNPGWATQTFAILQGTLFEKLKTNEFGKLQYGWRCHLCNGITNHCLSKLVAGCNLAESLNNGNAVSCGPEGSGRSS